jgi:putative colanic acid biosynthesis UDP-glucose lipid carrier transferase
MSPVSRGISFHESLFSSLHRLMDAAVICVAVGIALSHTKSAGLPDVLTISAATILVNHIMAELSGLYRSWRGTRLRREVGCMFLTWAYTVPVLLGAGLVTQHNAGYTYESKLVWIFATPIAMAAARVVLRKIQQRLRARGFNTRSYAICGVNELGIQLKRNIDTTPEMGLVFAGFYDDRPIERTTDLPREVGARVGDLEELVHRARRAHVDIVYITFPMRAEERIREVLVRLGDTTASVYIVPDFFVFELLHARWTNINGLPAVSVFENPLYGVDGLAKRTTDIVFGGLLLALAAMPMIVIATLIKLTSTGPVFFRQRRYGLDGREILVWKFRTMTCCDDGYSVRQATRDDDRVTSIGGILRRTSLDELPQLFNVVSGTMSLVGPRPHASAHNEQ